MARNIKVLGDNVSLPDGFLYQTGDEVTLTNAQFFEIDPTLVAEDESALIQDLGAVGIVLEQGPSVTLTSEAPPAATATVGDDDNTELLSDIEALRLTLASLVADLSTLRSALTGSDRAIGE